VNYSYLYDHYPRESENEYRHIYNENTAMSATRRAEKRNEMLFAAYVSIGSGCDGRILAHMPRLVSLEGDENRNTQIYELLHSKVATIRIKFRHTADNQIYCISHYAPDMLLYLLRANEYICPLINAELTLPLATNYDTEFEMIDADDDLFHESPATHELLHLLALRQPHSIDDVVKYYNKISPADRFLADLIGMPMGADIFDPNADIDIYALLYNLRNTSRSFKIQRFVLLLTQSRDIFIGCDEEYENKLLKLFPPFGIMLLQLISNHSLPYDSYIPYMIDNLRAIFEFASGCDAADDQFYQQQLHEYLYPELTMFYKSVSVSINLMSQNIIGGLISIFRMVAESYPQYLYMFFRSANNVVYYTDADSAAANKYMVSDVLECILESEVPQTGVIDFIRNNMARCPRFLAIMRGTDFDNLSITLPQLHDLVRNFPVPNNPLAEYLDDIIRSICESHIGIDPKSQILPNKATMDYMYLIFIQRYVMPTHNSCSDKGIMNINGLSAKIADILIECFCRCPMLLNYVGSSSISNTLSKMAQIYRRRIDMIYNISSLPVDVHHLIAQSFIDGADNLQHSDVYLALTEPDSEHT
jgi:hypothetical protein